MSRGCLRRLRNGPSRPAIYDALKTHSHRECWRQPGMAFPWRMSPGRPQISPPRGGTNMLVHDSGFRNAPPLGETRLPDTCQASSGN
jgi:hypothetical protein